MRHLGSGGAIRLGIAAVCQLTAFLFFTFSFLQVKPKRCAEDPHSSAEPAIDLEPLIDRLVFIVIDAFRSDFLYSEQSPMRTTRGLIKNGQAFGFIATASAPTVTMPRLKALTAGTPPVFLDLLSNLDETRMSSAAAGKGPFNDMTWIGQLKGAGKRIVFAGDDTWLRLFPAEYFLRVDPTTSFFVKVPFPCQQPVVGYSHCRQERNTEHCTRV